MELATWNVNSLRARLPRLVPWLAAKRPDVLCLQETKVADELFPREAGQDHGYAWECDAQHTIQAVSIV